MKALAAGLATYLSVPARWVIAGWVVLSTTVIVLAATRSVPWFATLAGLVPVIVVGLVGISLASGAAPADPAGLPATVWHGTRVPLKVGDTFTLDPAHCRAMSRMLRSDRPAWPRKASWAFDSRPQRSDLHLNDQGASTVYELRPQPWPSEVYRRGNALAFIEPVSCVVVGVLA